MMCVLQLLLLVGTGTTLFVPALASNGTNVWQYTIPDGGQEEIQCMPNNANASIIRWEVFGKILGQPMNSSNAEGLSNFNISKNSSLIVTNPRNSSLQGLVNVTCIASSNNTTNESRIIYRIAFFKVPKITNSNFTYDVPDDGSTKTTFSCRATGFPLPKIQWKFENVTLPAGNAYFVNTTDIPGANLTASNDGGLEVMSVNRHGGFGVTVVCFVNNTNGNTERNFLVRFLKARSFLFEITLVNASQYGTELAIAAKVERVFEDSKNILSLFTVNVTFVNATSGKVKFHLTWLIQELKDKDYILSDGSLDSATLAKIVHDKLIESGVDVDKFNMLDVKPGPPTHLSVNDVTKEEISFSWKKPEYFDVTGYQIQTNDGGSGWENVTQASGDKTGIVLDGLDSGTKYLIRMESINAKGTGLPSEQIQAETDALTGADIPADASVAVPVVIVVVVIVILVVLVLLAVVAGVRYYRYRPPEVVVMTMDENNPYFQSIPGVQVSNIHERDNMTFCPILEDGLQVDVGTGQALISWREITRESLTMGDELGHGEFGIVKRATWLDDQSNTKVPVAVKTIKDNATESERKDLFKELKLMADVSNHVNIVNMLGACSKRGPLWIIVELCEHGNLLNFLRKNRQETSGKTGDYISSLDPLLRVSIAYDVSKGMHFLEDKKIVHRDLAARNILLGKNKIAKIADFGLSRDIYEQGLYKMQAGGKLPVKWMAIESLRDQVYDSKSDVWSFGILFWEIETAGMAPYPGIDGRDVLDFLLNGFRLEQPSETPFEIYEIMKKCWEPSPKVRPRFQEIESELEAYLEKNAESLPVVMEEDQGDQEEAYVNYILDVEDDETDDTHL